MKILLACPTMQRAGTWFRCFYLGRELAALGHEVTLLKTSAARRVVPEVLWEAGVRIVDSPRFFGGRVSFDNTRLPSDLLFRAAFGLRERFDVVHTFSHHLNAMAPSLLARGLGRSACLVADWDDLWTNGGLRGQRPDGGRYRRLSYDFDAWGERRLKGYADGVTVVSHDLARRAVADGVPAERIELLPNGAPVDEIRPADRRAARARLGLPLGRPIAVFVGFGQYDVDLIFDALALLRARGEAPLVTLTGPHPDLIRAAAQARGVAEDVHVAGLVPWPEMVAHLQAADLGLLPFADKPLNWARWPIKLGDYLAAGLPVLTNDVGEMGRMVQEHAVGLATAPTAVAFAEGLAALLADRPALAALGVRARGAALATSWRAVAEQAAALYDRLLTRRRSRAARNEAR